MAIHEHVRAAATKSPRRQLCGGAAALLILAPIVFFVGQGADAIIAWAGFNVTYSLGRVASLAAPAPTGLRCPSRRREHEALALSAP